MNIFISGLLIIPLLPHIYLFLLFTIICVVELFEYLTNIFNKFINFLSKEFFVFEDFKLLAYRLK